MFNPLAQSRARRRLEVIAPNPRGRTPLHPARRRRSGLFVALVLIAAGGLVAAALGLHDTPLPRAGAGRAPGGGFLACGNGRWVSDPARCF